MTFTNKIEAIKALRTLADANPFSIVKGEGNTFIVNRGYLGLKDCKDFVEAVMAYALQDAKKLKYCSCNTELKPEHKYCPGCGQYNPYTQNF